MTILYFPLNALSGGMLCVIDTWPLLGKDGK